MLRFTLAALLFPCLAGLAVRGARADGGKPCGRCDCPPPPVDCVQGPAPKVIVEMSPPEIIFQEAPAATPCEKPSEKPCFLKRVGHRCRPQPVCVQPAFAPTMSTVSVQQTVVPSVATSFIPVQTAAIQTAAVPVQTSALAFASVPQVAATSSFPVASMAFAQPSYNISAVPQMASFQAAAAPAPTQMMAVALVPAACQNAGSAGAAGAGRLSEEDVQAAVLTLRKINTAMVAQAAVAQAAAAQAANGQGVGAASVQLAGFDRRLEELKTRVESMDKRMQAILDALKNR